MAGSGKVMVTGAAGYVGSKLVPELKRRGHSVTAIDLGIYGFDHCDFAVIEGSIDSPDVSWFDGVSTVINLAGLSNDPQANFSPELSFRYNAAGALTLAFYAKAHGVTRFVQASTCSVYAGSPQEMHTEETELTTVPYPYSLSKIMAERGLLALEDHGFKVVILRKGTIGGGSPRFRSDLVVNTMVCTALSDLIIKVYNPAIWRPLLHIDDAVECYVRSVDHLPGLFNVAVDNYTVLEIAESVFRRLKAGWGIEPYIKTLSKQGERNYSVALNKLDESWSWSPELGVGDMVDSVMYSLPEDYDSSSYKNINGWKTWLKDYF